MRDYDVIVIGSGGAGLSAAIHAAQGGARVLVAEAAERLGGSTALSGGVFYAADTSLQRECGIADDSPEAMFHYLMGVNQWRAEPDMIRTLCENSTPMFEYLRSLGVNFPRERLYHACVSGVRRGHQASEFGSEIARALENRMGSLENIDVAKKTRVRRLLHDASGGVSGIHVDGQDVRAGAVVIASGGFGHNKALLQRYYPTAAQHGDRIHCILAPDCKGDGIMMGEQVGAAIHGFDRGLLCTNPTFSPVEINRPPWLVYVNREGRRFIDESMTYFGFNAVQNQTGGGCFAIFDEDARLSARPFDGDAYSANSRSDNWTADRLAQFADEGKILKSDTLEGLAELCGIFNPRALVNSIARFNADVDKGRDTQFFRAGETLRPVRKAPYYAVEMKTSVVALTFTGLRINPRAEVLSEDECVIPGLYAAGDATGNVLCFQYGGGGTSIGNATVFGKIAGAEAARFARN